MSFPYKSLLGGPPGADGGPIVWKAVDKAVEESAELETAADAICPFARPLFLLRGVCNGIPN